MQVFGFLELHRRAGLVASRLGRLMQRRSLGAQELLDPRSLSPVLFRRHHLLAGPQALVHFAIDAAGMIGRRRQVFLAATELEQVQHFVLESFCCPAPGKGSVIQPSTEPRREHRPREGIVHRQPQKHGRLSNV